MEGEEGGVAASLITPEGEPWVGGDVEGTAKLTATPSSVSPSEAQKLTLAPSLRLIMHYSCFTELTCRRWT